MKHKDWAEEGQYTVISWGLLITNVETFWILHKILNVTTQILIKRILVPHQGLTYHNTQGHIPHHPNVHTILMGWEICISYCMSTCVIYSWKNYKKKATL